MSIAAVSSLPAGDASPPVGGLVPLSLALADEVGWAWLAESAAEPNPFAGPAMSAALARHFGYGMSALRAPHPDGAGLLYAVPVRQRRKLASFGLRVIEIAATHYGPLGTPLLAADRVDEAAGRLLDAAMAPKAAAFVLPFQTLNGPVAAALTTAAASKGLHVRITGRYRRAALDTRAAEADAFGDAGSGRRQKEYRRLLRRLGDAGKVSFTTAEKPDEVCQALEEFLLLEQRGWKGRGGTALADRPHRAGLARDLIAALAGRGRVRIDALRLDDQAIAMLVTLKAGAVAWTWKTAYDEAHAGISPGVQVMLAASRALMADPGIVRADSLAVPNHPMIDKVWAGRLEMGTLVIATHRRHAALIAAGITAAARLHAFASRAKRRVTAVLTRR